MGDELFKNIFYLVMKDMSIYIYIYIYVCMFDIEKGQIKISVSKTCLSFLKIKNTLN
jgi:hypothetical protein